jgi:hypothetical protein
MLTIAMRKATMRAAKRKKKEKKLDEAVKRFD